MYKLKLTRGYYEITFSFDNWSEVSSFMYNVLHHIEGEKTVQVELEREEKEDEETGV